MPTNIYTIPYGYTDNTTWSGTSQITYEITPVAPPAAPPPKVATALDWLKAQVDEVVQIGRRELVAA